MFRFRIARTLAASVVYPASPDRFADVPLRWRPPTPPTARCINTWAASRTIDTEFTGSGSFTDPFQRLVDYVRTTAPSTLQRQPPPGSSSAEAERAACREVPPTAMTVAELSTLREVSLACSIAYVQARHGASAVEALTEDVLPGFTPNFRLSDDDHVTLVNRNRRQVLFSCRGTDPSEERRKKRDVHSYWAILRCRTVDPSRHPRIHPTLAACRKAHQRYAVELGYSFVCVGHSLGGFAASVCAQELDCPAYNINGPVFRPYTGVRLVRARSATEVIDAASRGQEPAAAAAEMIDGRDGGGGGVATAVQQIAAADDNSTIQTTATTLVDDGTPRTVSRLFEHCDPSRLLKRWREEAAPSSSAPRPPGDFGGTPSALRERAKREESTAAASPSSPSSFVAQRRGWVHHIRLGNDVVSLVGGAQPHECERYTALHYDGSVVDLRGAHCREHVTVALEREILAARARAVPSRCPLMLGS